MDYKPSKFNVVIELNNNEILLYNTANTGMCVVSNEIYLQYFRNRQFDKTETFFNLVDCGFFVPAEKDELYEQKLLREKALTSNLDGIYGVTISPTNLCNARCHYCYERPLKKRLSMSEETVKNTINFLHKNINVGNKLKIVWHGGEPLLEHRIITEICKSLSEKNITVESHINTNGLLFNKDIIDNAKDIWHLTHVQITVDGIEEEYNRIKNYNCTVVNPFQIVMNNIRELLDNDIEVVIRVNFSYGDTKKTLDLIHYLDSKFSDSQCFSIYPAPLYGEEEKYEKQSNKEAIHPYLQVLSPLIEKDYFKYGEKWPLMPRLITCMSRSCNNFYISPEGKLYLCQHAETYSNNSFVGDVVNGMTMNNIFKNWCNSDCILKVCDDCVMLPLCQGGCKSAHEFENRTPCINLKPILKDFIMLTYKTVFKLNNN